MKIKAIIGAILVALFSGQAQAEYCDMIGCKGDIAWMYIPAPQYSPAFDAPSMKVTRGKETTEYTIDTSKQLFRTRGLPEVNAIAELNADVKSLNIPDCLTHDACSSDVKERWALIQQIEKNGGVHFDETRKIASVDDTAYQCREGGSRGCWDFNEGMKLKILSYTTMDGVLFALVRVED